MTVPRGIPQQLTLSFVRHVKAPGKYHDLHGLYLNVSAKGRKRWMQRVTVQGRRRDISIGSAHEMTPAQARKIAVRNRDIARAGGNPLAVQPDKRRTPNAAPCEITFSRFTLNRYRRQVAEGKGLAKLKEERSRVVRFVVPEIGRQPVSMISAADLQELLKVVAKENVNTADHLRRQLAMIFDDAVAEKLRADNPARSGEIMVPRRRKRVSGEGDARNKRLLAEFPAFLKALEETGRRPSLVFSIRFCLLTLRNPKECRLATWPQIDLEARLWRFPVMQKEGAQTAEVRLHDGLVHLLKQARLLSRGDGQGWVFPSPLDVDQPYSEHASYNVPRELGFEIKQLDFRRVHEYWSERRQGKNSLEDWWRFLTET
jgi:integrase